MQKQTNCVKAAVRSTSMRAIAVMAVLCALSWQACHAQVLKGSQPGETKLPAVRLHERITALQGPGRTSPKIANPYANQHDNSSITVVCRNQKLNADREALGMQASLRAMGDGSVKKGITDGTSKSAKKAADGCETSGGNCANKSANSNNAISGNRTISGNGAPQTEMRKAGGDPGSKVGVSEYQRQALGGTAGAAVPQGPMKTESAQGNQGPGGAGGANPNVVLQPCSPTITTISGFPTAIFSPSSLFNPYTIKGCGFGYQMGNVYLTGPFNAGKIKLQVQSTPGNQKVPGRASWSDTAIVVSVDPRLSGEVLQQNVTLVVEPVSGPSIQKAGNKFLPAYEDVMLQTIPKSAVQFSQAGGLNAGKGSVIMAPSLSIVAPDLLYFSPSQTPKGMSAEVFRGGTTSFFPASTDYYDFSGLAAGYWVVSMQLHQEADPTGCDPGSESFAGSWNAQYDSNGNIRVTWKEFRCLFSTLSPNPAVWSDYALNVMVKGPRGIDPWTGRRLLSMSPTMAPALH